MKNRMMFAMWACFAIATSSIPGARAECTSGPVVVYKHSIEFKGVLYDNARNVSTWYYTVTSGKKPAISHVTFELICPDIQIVDAGMWDGTYPSPITHLYKAGLPEPGTFPAAPKGDPTTGVLGLKFDLGFNDNQTRNYYLTVNGTYAEGPMRVAIKGGNRYDLGSLCGPSADCDPHEVPLSSLGDRVWNDLNSNGIQDAGEPGVPGVAVRLLDASATVLSSTVTDASGLYLFDQLVDGQYYVAFVLPAGHVFTIKNAGSDPEKNSDADPVSGLSDLINLPLDTHRRDIDAGIIQSTAAIRMAKTGVFKPGTLDPWANCDVFGGASVFNALIFGDFEVVGGGDTEGRLAVGGHAIITGGYSVGQAVFGDPMPEYYGAQVDSFIVGGNLTDGVWGVNGNIVYGGERTGARRYMINGNVVRKQDPITFNGQGNVPYDGSGMNFAQMRTQLLARSAALAVLGDRGVTAKYRDPAPYGDLILTGNDDALNIFNITTVDWSMTSAQIRLTAPSNATVIINIHGAVAGITNASMLLTGVAREHVLIHYADATFIAAASFDFEGSVLALYANTEFSAGSINGRAVLGGQVLSKNGFEFHNFEFNGHICLDGQEDPTPPQIAYAFVVENIGALPLQNVVISDPLVPVSGGPITLAPGASNSTSFTATLVLDEALLAAGGFTNYALAVGYTADGRAVSASNSAVVIFPAAPTNEPPDPVDPEPWMKADFVVQSVELVPSPTLVATRFRAQVRVVNEGDIAGSPVSMAMWSSLSEWNSDPSEAPSQEIFDAVDMAPGEVRIYELGEFRAPDAVDTFHTIARVNRSRTTDEYSYGNNFGGVTYSLQPVLVEVLPAADGTVLLKWNSAEEYYYFVERANGLDQPYVDIADNLLATPPHNLFVDDEAPATPAYYRVWGYKR